MDSDRRCSVVLLFFLAAAGICSVSAHDHSHASRAIQPVNPKLYMDGLKKNYPLDGDSNSGTKFHHPFPSVQDTDKFEYDFVKDDSKDNGEFKAQSNYDRLRAKVAEERRLAQQAKDHIYTSDDELHHAEAEEHDAEEKAKIARKEAEEAEKRANSASGEVDGVSGKKRSNDTSSGGGGSNDTSSGGGGPMPGSEKAYTIPEAEAGVKAAANHLEGCKEQLEKAQKNLENVMANQEAMARIKANATAQANGEAQANATAHATRDGKHVKVLSDEEQSALANERYEKELKDVELAQKQLEEAAQKLCKFRGGPCLKSGETKDDSKDSKDGETEPEKKQRMLDARGGGLQGEFLVHRSGALASAQLPSALAVIFLALFGSSF